MSTPILDETESDHPAWEKLKAMHARGDFDKIERMVRVYDGLEAMGTVGGVVTRILMWCAGIGTAYLVIENWIRSIK